MLAIGNMISVYINGTIGVSSVMNKNIKVINLSSILSGVVIGISMTTIVLLIVQTNFSNQSVFIYCYNLPLIGVNVSD